MITLKLVEERKGKNEKNRKGKQNFGRASGVPLGFNFSVSDIERMPMFTLKLVDERWGKSEKNRRPNIFASSHARIFHDGRDEDCARVAATGIARERE